MSLCRSMCLSFVFFFPALWCGIEAQALSLESRVYVAFTREDLSIMCHLTKPANVSQTKLRCFDPLSQQFHISTIQQTGGDPTAHYVRLSLKNPVNSGEYYCQHQADKVYWFLRLRDWGYKDLARNDYTECILVIVTVFVLLVLSLIGSWYVFRGSLEWIRGRMPRGSKRRQVVEENIATAATSSVYASLDPHTQSIYSVLDQTSKPEQKQGAPKSAKTPKTVSPEVQGAGVFESVYENFNIETS